MYEVRWQDFDKRDYVILILTLFSKLKLYQKLTIFLFFLYSFQTNEVGVSTNRHCDMLHILILNWDRCPSQTCTAVSVRTPSPTASPPATTSPPQTSPCVRSASSGHREKVKHSFEISFFNIKPVGHTIFRNLLKCIGIMMFVSGQEKGRFYLIRFGKSLDWV